MSKSISLRRLRLFASLVLTTGAAPAIADGTVTGGGTPGKVPVFSNETTVTNSNITQSGENVGIGTSNPNTLLHLHLGSRAGPTLLMTNSNSSSRNSIIYLGSGSPGVGKHFFLSNDWLGEATDKFTIGYNDAGHWKQYLAIMPWGNIGIGTTTPHTLLHLNKDTHAGPTLLLTNQSDTSKNSVVYLGSGMPGAGNHFFLSNDWRGYNEDLFTIGYNKAGAWTEHVALTRTGKMGIGTTNPTVKLQIESAAGGDYITAGSGAFRVTNNGDVYVRGTLIGAKGDPGPPGPAVHTSAACSSSTYSNCYSICASGRVVANSYAPCSITADTGSCSNYYSEGVCCVCAP